MSVTTDLRLALSVLDDGDAAENIAGTMEHRILESTSWSDGTGSNAADIVWSDRRQVAASASDTLDLAGVLTDAFGNTLTFVEVRLILVRNRNTTAGDALAIEPASSNGFLNWVGDASDQVVVGPGGIFLLTSPIDGFAVTAGTGDDLDVTETGGANPVDYDIVIVGTTA